MAADTQRLLQEQHELIMRRKNEMQERMRNRLELRRMAESVSSEHGSTDKAFRETAGAPLARSRAEQLKEMRQ